MDTDFFDFSIALTRVRAGGRIARKGWNGKGMFLVLVPGSEGLTVDEGRPLAKAGVTVGTKFNYLPHIDMRTAQGDFVPWLASQTDLLARDWYEVREDDFPSDRWFLTADTLKVGVVDIRAGDRITDGNRTETVQAIICGSYDADLGPAIFTRAHADGSPSPVLLVDQFIDGGWRKVESE